MSASCTLYIVAASAVNRPCNLQLEINHLPYAATQGMSFALAKNRTLQQLSFMQTNIKLVLFKIFFSVEWEILQLCTINISRATGGKEKNPVGMMCEIAQGNFKLSCFHAISKCVNCYWNRAVETSGQDHVTILSHYDLSYQIGCNSFFAIHFQCDIRLHDLNNFFASWYQQLNSRCWGM